MADSRPDQGTLNRLDGLTSWVERPVRRVVGSERFNPLPHAGTISVFLLIVVVVSGLYITLFFQYGYEASYDSVAAMERHPIQRTIRALHRYSSAALVVTSLVHAWRIFIAGRFTVRRRRWRWLTGWATLLIVWPAGVTGYLLVWDTRAQAIADGLIAAGSWSPFGAALSARYLAGIRDSGGSGFLLVIWLIHLALTVVAGYSAFRHLRRSALAWRPPRHWMILLGVSLVVISLVLPVGMLGRADPTVVADRIPLDPFVLFLLPILEAEWRWIGLAVLATLTALGLLIPFLARGGGRPPAQILTDACTGCNLCVVDCPYLALSLVTERSEDSATEVGEEGGEEPRKVAVVDEAACTSCGICLGSCAFDAIKVPGISLESTTVAATIPADLESPTVVSVVCDRHLVDGTLGGGGDHGSIMAVRCAGVVGVDLVKGLRDAGATEVHIVGCARNDCRYGVGNTLASERITGTRAPHLPRAARSSVSEQWAGLHDLDHAEISLDEASEVMGSENRRSLVAAGAVVAASAVAIAAATFTPFGQGSDEAAVRVVVDQEPGRPLLGADEFTVAVDQVVLAVDGEQQVPAAVSESGGERVGVHQWSVPVGRHRLVLTVKETRTESGANEGRETTEAVVFDETVELQPNQRLQLPVVAQPLEGDATMGRELFESRITGCSICHSVRAGDDRVGPSLYGIGSRASTRVAGLDAETYLWQSILLPDEYIVEGYPAGQMLPIYRDRLSQEELDAIVDYLLTLTEEESGPQSGQDGGSLSEDGS